MNWISQVDVNILPTPADDPWVWISGLLVTALIAIFIRYDGRPARSDFEMWQHAAAAREAACQERIVKLEDRLASYGIPLPPSPHVEVELDRRNQQT